MFSLANFTTALLLLASSTNATPAPSTLPPGFEPITRDEILRRMNTNSSETKTLEKSILGNYVYLCTGDNYTGTCGARKQQFNQCIELKSPFYHHTYSFGLSGPDQGVVCQLTAFYADTCTPGDDVTVLYPGTGALRNYNAADVGDHLTSFVCQK